MTTSNEHNNAPAVTQGEPVACLVRQRTLRTRAAIAHDGQDHFSEWSDWYPATLKYGTAVTDPRRNSGPEHLFEMLPLVLAAPAPAVPTDSDPTSKEQYRRMFVAACEALGAISDALGCDPEDGGAEPILGAVEELHIGLGLSNGILGCLSAAPAVPQGEPDDGLRSIDGFYGDDHIQDIAHALAQECEEAELDPNDYVTVNREKLVAIAKRVLTKAAAMLAATPAPAPAVPEKLPSAMATSQADGKWRVTLEFDAHSDADALKDYMLRNGVPAKSMVTAPAQEPMTVTLTDEEIYKAVVATCEDGSAPTFDEFINLKVAKDLRDFSDHIIAALRAKGGK